MTTCGFSWRPTSSPARSRPSRPPRRSPRGWRDGRSRRRARPGADVGRRTRVRRRAARRRSDGELLAVTVRGPHGDADPGHRPGGRRDGVRRERAGLRAAPDRSRRAPRARRPTASASWSPAPSTPAPRPWWSDSGGSGTNDGGAGSAGARWAPPPTCPSTPAAPASTASPRSTSRPRRERVGPGAAGRGQRRGQPADRAVRRHQGVRSPEGHHRGAARRPATPGWSSTPAALDRRVALEKGAGAAGGLGYALLAARRRPASPASTLVADGRRTWPSAPGRSTWSSRARAPSTSPVGPGRCPHGVADGGRGGAACRAWCWPARC